MAEPIRPLIEVYWTGSLFSETLRQRLAEGMEEEGVPYRFSEQPANDAVSLSSQAAHASTLEVGVGLDAQGNMAVHTRRLPVDQPLFLAAWPHDAATMRRFGSHAARLVKGLPFRLNEQEGNA